MSVNDINWTKGQTPIGHHQDIRIHCQKWTCPVPSLWRLQNLHWISGCNVSDWRAQDVHWTSRIDSSYWPQMDQSSDIHRTSLGCQDSSSDSELSWTKLMTSPGHLHDVWPRRQYLTCADVPRPLSERPFWPYQNRTFPDSQGCQVFAMKLALEEVPYFAWPM